jgi:transcriptional regulator with GAF, ATPase, and Fis domain
LQNVLERAVILTSGSVLRISSEDLRMPDQATVSPPAPQTGPSSGSRAVSDEAERQRILRALEQADGIVAGPNGAAARLGMKRSTLQARMQKLGIHISRTAA